MPPPQGKPRVALCFFGITRSLTRTLPSIERNVIAPARAAGEARLFAHFFQQTRIENPRTGESADLAPDEHRLIDWDALALEPPGECLARWHVDRIRAHGDDVTDDGGQTTRNLVHQLHSIREVAALAEPWAPDLWVFARPDLRYHDSLAPTLARALKGPPETAYLPLWQWRGGHNDRFAVIRGDTVARAYGRRAERMEEFCEATGQPLHAERLVGHVLRGHRVRRITARATRVRADGTEAWECFSFEPLERMHVALEAAPAPHLAKRVGHRTLQAVQQALNLAIPG